MNRLYLLFYGCEIFFFEKSAFSRTILTRPMLQQSGIQRETQAEEPEINSVRPSSLDPTTSSTPTPNWRIRLLTCFFFCTQPPANQSIHIVIQLSDLTAGIYTVQTRAGMRVIVIFFYF